MRGDKKHAERVGRLIQEHEETTFELRLLHDKYAEIIQKLERNGVEPGISWDEVLKRKLLTEEEVHHYNVFDSRLRYMVWLEAELLEAVIRRTVAKQFFTEPNLEDKTVKVFCVKCEASRVLQLHDAINKADEVEEWCKFHLITSDEECKEK